MRPLRIVIVSTYYHPTVGGCETHARQVGHYLATHGFEVLLLTRRTPPDSPRDDVDGPVVIRRLLPAGSRRGMGKWLLIPAMFVELVRRRDWYDLTFCVDLRGLALAVWAASLFARKPVVFQAETPGAITMANWTGLARRKGGRVFERLVRALTFPLRRIYGSADAYTCIARQFIEEGVDVGVARDRLHHVPHAVDESRFRPATELERAAARNQLGLPPARPVVMFLGRLGVEKGILDLLEAWRQLAHPDALLAIVGPDMTGHHLDAGDASRLFVKRHGLEHSVRFLGSALDPALVLQAADIFVQPSHYEAFGISLIEAMATGLAVVASGVGGMQDYLVDGENALIAGPQAPDRLAVLIGRLLVDDGARRALGAEARRTIEERFTERSIGHQSADLFRELILGSRSRARSHERKSA